MSSEDNVRYANKGDELYKKGRRYLQQLEERRKKAAEEAIENELKLIKKSQTVVTGNKGNELYEKGRHLVQQLEELRRKAEEETVENERQLARKSLVSKRSEQIVRQIDYASPVEAWEKNFGIDLSSYSVY